MLADFSPFIPGFIAAYAILLVAASSPGPAVAMLLGISMSQGRGAAMWATGGIATASACINLMTMAGVGLILSQAAWAMSILKVIGAAYLLWLAWGAFRKALAPPVLKVGEADTRSPARHFLHGFVLQVSNPKAIVFWLAIAAVGATEGGGLGIVMLFVAGACCISFACHGAWALFFSAAPVRAAYQSVRGWVEAALGAFFCFAAYKLATSES